ncbi:toll/interleukin-1 receptor domain-containing protein [Arthrobacter sp. KN11-1C]|uniref:toll/interleukin-1 receptor domain-containing protein n=1 Tax=Arthrobacter sp. KN11-1C TaxID=3445774 RepID=UPI003FA1291A
MTFDSAASAQTEKHAFISYVREDSERVDQLQRVLEAFGVKVWRDKKDLPPGSDWRTEIRKAITQGSLAFIACFSEASAAREISYQFEELVLAVEQYRLRPPAKSWLFPVRFDDVSLPDYTLGAGKTLDDIHRTDYFGPQHVAELVKLANAVAKLLGPQADNSQPLNSGADTRSASPEEDPGRVVKGMLRDPSRDIDLDDFVMGVASKIRSQLADDPQFSVALGGSEPDSLGVVEQIVDRLAAYQNVLEPFAKILVVAGAWGEEKHAELWRRAAKLILNAHSDSGHARLVALQQFVPMYLSYVSAIASTDKSNFYSLEALLDTPIRTHRGPEPVITLTHPHYMFNHTEVWVPTAVTMKAEGQPVTPAVIEGFRTRQQGARFTPVPTYLFKVLRPLFIELIPDDEDYDERFDRAEALLALKACVAKVEAEEAGHYGIGKWDGRYTWKPRYMHNGPDKALADEYKAQGERWAPITQGLLGKNAVRVRGGLSVGNFDTHAIDEALSEFLDKKL